MSKSNINKTGKKPEFRNINAMRDLPTYRLPVAGWVSILHRASGAIMFLLMPFIIWMFDTSISSEISFEKFNPSNLMVFDSVFAIFPEKVVIISLS